MKVVHGISVLVMATTACGSPRGGGSQEPAGTSTVHRGQPDSGHDPEEDAEASSHGGGGGDVDLSAHETDVSQLSEPESFLPDAEGPQEFFSIVNVNTRAVAPLTDDEMINSADVIVRGEITSISDGRVIERLSGASFTYETAVFEVRVDALLKGESQGGFVYIEVIRGAIGVEFYQEAQPDRMPLFLFLEKADNWDPGTYTFSNEGRGLPEGGVLVQWVSNAGVVLESKANGLAFPLGQEHWDTEIPGYFEGIGSFAELEEYLRQVLNPGN